MHSFCPVWCFKDSSLQARVLSAGVTAPSGHLSMGVRVEIPNDSLPPHWQPIRFATCAAWTCQH
eukprot:6481647-Amphidinium_carterae.1